MLRLTTIAFESFSKGSFVVVVGIAFAFETLQELSALVQAVSDHSMEPLTGM